MSKAIKKLLSVLLCAALLFGIAPLNGFTSLELPSLSSLFAVKANAASGSCGVNLTWNYDTTTATLTISGTGAMFDYALNLQSMHTSAPWGSYYQTIKTLVIESGVPSISKWAFVGCTGLTSVTIPNSVTSIGNFAFFNCTGLTSVTIGSGVTSIGSWAFKNCTGLTNLTISDGAKTNIGEQAFYLCTALTNVRLGDSITSIDASGFSNCRSLTSITIPDSVTKIGPYAFVECTGLTSVTIGSGVTSIGSCAFQSCNVLTNLTISDGAKTNIGEQAFYLCTALTNVRLGDSITSIDASGFSNCKSLTSITIPDSVSRIGPYAFVECTGLTSITIPDSVTIIDEHAFYLCPSLKDVYYEGSTADKAKISIGGYNDNLKNATWHYDYTYPDDTAHAVTYNYSINGGSSATKTSATVAEGAAIDLTPTAVKTGWTFVGWNTNQNATTGLSSLAMGSGNVTLYAIYKKTLTATFIDYSGTTKKTTTKTVDIFNKATSGTVSAPTQNTYTGWTSRGWSTGTAADAGTTSNFTISNNTTYYGLYQRTLTLSYNANGGSSTPSSQTGTQYANSYAISTYKNPSFTLANAISKSGSTFGGWAMGSTGGTKYNAGASVSISANTTMYASWTTSVNIYNLGEETYSFGNYGDSDSASGHCFGMSITSGGYYTGNLNISSVGIDSAQRLYTVSSTDKVRKPICYYQKKQGSYAAYSIVSGGSLFKYNVVDIESDWSQMVNYVKNHDYDNKGNLQITFFGYCNYYGQKTWSGHAVNFLYYKEVNGQQRIYIYDNNFPKNETYFYKDSNGMVRQAPDQTFDISIESMAFHSIPKYFEKVESFDSTHVLYAYDGEIAVNGVKGSPMCATLSEGKMCYMYEIPEDESKVVVTPLTNNASFEYLDKEYSFDIIGTNTYGELSLAELNMGTEQTANWTIKNAPKKVQKVTVSDLTIDYKASAKLNPIITADTGVQTTVKFSSSDPSRVKVDEKTGEITGVKRGSATITVTVTDSSGNTAADTCKVTVKYTALQWIIKILLFGWLWY